MSAGSLIQAKIACAEPWKAAVPPAFGFWGRDELAEAPLSVASGVPEAAPGVSWIGAFCPTGCDKPFGNGKKMDGKNI
jgi:hypothetical protein